MANHAAMDSFFMRNLRRVLDVKGPTLVVWVHGMGGKSNRIIRDQMGIDGKLDCLIGFGQPNRHTARPELVEQFIEFFGQNELFDSFPLFCGWDRNNMNQWCRGLKEYQSLDSVQSIQLEFSAYRRRRTSLDETARVVSEALSALVRRIQPKENETANPTGFPPAPENTGQVDSSPLVLPVEEPASLLMTR